MSAVIQVVPPTAARPEGVGSFAASLAGALDRRCGVESRIVALSQRDGDGPGVCGALAAAGDRSTTPILVHYANYAYQARGCPTWLIEGLERWKEKVPGCRLVTVFHELYASGPPWRSSFWLSPRQRQLAARLLGISDAAATSLEYYAAVLRRWRPGIRVAVAPVFSNIGEPASVAPLDSRPRRLLLFGGAGARHRAWHDLRKEVVATCESLGLEEVWDVGPPAGAPARLDGLPVRELGVLSPEDVSARLLASFAGFVAYPAAFLGKSGIFAAYTSHGLLPVCAWNRRRGAGAANGVPPHWNPVQPAPLDAGAVAAAAHSWYARHSLERHAETFQELLAA